MDRRSFLTFAAGSVALGALMVVQGCSSGGGDSTPSTPTTPETPTYTDKNAKVSSNHGHTFTLTAAQQQAGTEAKIFSRGGDHSHKITLSAADVATVVAGTTWSGESSVDMGHSHVITFN
jgi:hypothetical protein